MAATLALTEELLAEKLGLTEAHLLTLSKKPALLAALEEAVAGTSALEDGVDPKTGAMLFTLVTKVAGAKTDYIPIIGRYIVDSGIDTASKLQGALHFVKNSTVSAKEMDRAAFETAAGVGVVVRAEEIGESVGAIIDSMRSELETKRYIVKENAIIVKLREAFPRTVFADGAAVNAAVSEAMLNLLGPRTEADEVMIKEWRKKGKAGKGGKKGKGGGGDAAATSASAASAAASSASTSEETEDSVKDAFAARDMAAAVNSAELLKQHASVTKGVIRTRFPPEPNGFLHIGHAKSMNLNFKLAFRIAGHPEGGDTIFRYDDTNPEAESQEYIDSQAENVAWMGWKPCRVTYSSDYFDELHDFALRLIRDGKAYVCHQTAEEMAASRELRRAEKPGFESPWRDRPVAENLAEFAKMREGRYSEGEAVLRLKMDWSSGNTNMWDLIAYRIKFTPHPHAGSAWCIYPSYDYTHCIVDSIEHIDLSLCTLEFENKRDSYYWLLEALDLWRPRVWEFSRLNIARNVLSKRKILKLVTSGIVRGWDDPRLLTINGIRRRGFPAEAINSFCDEVGVTRSENVVRPELLEHHARLYHDAHAPRAFAVLRPLQVTLTNVPADFCEEETAPCFPKDASRGARTFHLSRTLFIEESDFREDDHKSFFGLAPGKTVGLRYAGLVTCTGFSKDASGRVVGVEATYSADRTSKPKGNLHFVSSRPGEAPVRAEVRLYEDLFLDDFPGAATGDFLADLNPASEVVVTDAVIEPGLVGGAFLDAYQFERLGYFVVDKDATPERMVFNRVVTLRESADSKAIKAAAAV